MSAQPNLTSLQHTTHRFTYWNPTHLQFILSINKTCTDTNSLTITGETKIFLWLEQECQVAFGPSLTKTSRRRKAFLCQILKRENGRGFCVLRIIPTKIKNFWTPVRNFILTKCMDSTLQINSNFFLGKLFASTREISLIKTHPSALLSFK